MLLCEQGAPGTDILRASIDKISMALESAVAAAVAQGMAAANGGLCSLLCIGCHCHSRYAATDALYIAVPCSSSAITTSNSPHLHPSLPLTQPHNRAVATPCTHWQREGSNLQTEVAAMRVCVLVRRVAGVHDWIGVLTWTAWLRLCLM